MKARFLCSWVGVVVGGFFGQAKAEESISFVRHIKPIFDLKCVACHACNDAPAQLEMRTARGIERGAAKVEPYRPRLTPIPSTLMRASPNTTADWRKIGFFSVTEGGENSIMAKLLELGKANPVVPNQRFTTSIELDSLRRSNFMPNAAEIDGYVKAHPLEGMPLAVTGLTEHEHNLVITWLKQGAPFDEVAPKPTEKEIQKVKEWETFLNGEDNKSRLIARYIYEHHNLFEIYFDDSGNYFHLIRSKTPPGEKPVPVSARMPNEGVEGPFYYRLSIVNRTRVAKVHQLLLDARGDKLERYKKIFSETDWDVDTLPGYSKEERVDPLNTFAAIPAKARWKFLLADAWLHRGSIVWGPVCRGNLIVDSVQEQEWDFFEDPETSLYVNDEEYRKELAPYLALPSEPDDLFSFMNSLREYFIQREAAITKAMQRLEKSGGSRSRISDIWDGDEPGDTPLISIYRNGDNAFVANPGLAVGDYPKTAWVLDLPILEQMIYGSVVNFDLFGSVGVWLCNREAFGMARRAAELNFLRFLPADKREAIYESWYQGKLTEKRRELEKDIINLGPDVEIPSGITFKTDDPKTEFQQMLLEHVKASTKIQDPINRPDGKESTDPVMTALRSIVEASKKEVPTAKKFKNLIPEATFLRIDRPDQKPLVYTMTLDRDLRTKAFAVSMLQNEDPAKARVTIYPGVLTAYPNFIFRIKENEIGDFANQLIAAETPEQFTGLVEKWGVRRSNPDFWNVLHSITGYVQNQTPERAAIFDINRYQNL